MKATRDYMNSLRVGHKVRLFYGQFNRNNCTLHIRGEIDGNIIVRFWLRHKKRWRYEVKDIYYFHCNRQYMTKAGKS